MATDLIDAQITTTRDKANAERAAFTATRDSINQNTRLSDEGKREEIAAARARANQNIRELHDHELTTINTARENIERKLAGGIGSAPEAVIAYRDAQDRADAIKDPHTALRIVERALRSGDDSLANAVTQRAIDNGWNEPADLYAKAHPEMTADLTDRSTLGTYTRDIKHVFQRGAIYSPIS